MSRSLPDLLSEIIAAGWATKTAGPVAVVLIQPDDIFEFRHAFNLDGDECNKLPGNYVVIQHGRDITVFPYMSEANAWLNFKEFSSYA